METSKNLQETESLRNSEKKFEVIVNISKQENDEREITSSSEQKVTKLFENFQPSLLSLNKKMQSLSNQSIDIGDNEKIMLIIMKIIIMIRITIIRL